MTQLRVLLIVVLAVPLPALAQSNFCPRDGFDESVVWTVDAGTNAACEPHVGCSSGGVCIQDPAASFEYRCKGVVDAVRITAGTTNPALSEAQVLTVFDTVLQSWMRESRARGRAKISSQTAPCSVLSNNTIPCIGFAPASEVDWVWREDENGTLVRVYEPAKARAACTGTSCRFMINIDRWRPQSWVTSDNNSNIAVFAHEFGHAVGLNHADDCNAGCNGELMCATANRSHHLAPGDARGARNALQGTPDVYAHRFVGSGSREIGSTSATTHAFIDPTNENPLAATHLARIDCASYANAYAQCAAVVPFQKGNGTQSLRIVALNGWSETGGWSNARVVATFDGVNNLAPDIALSPYGNEAYFVRSAVGNTVTIGRVDLQTGAINSSTLAFESVLPPRIDFSEDGVVVVGQRVAAAGEAPRWAARRVQWTGTQFSVKVLDFGTLDDAPAEAGSRLVLSDFDFACRHDLFAADQCVLVAPLFEEGNPSHDIGRVSSRQFSVSSSGKVTMATQWTHSTNIRATAVTGVTIAPGPKLIVSTSRRSDNGSDANSQTREYSAYTVANSSLSFAHRSDVNTNCENATVNGIAIGAATPNGGVALDWCPQCGGAGRVESLQFYRETGNVSGSFCF